MTGVDPEPKLHGPPAVTRDWYSLRHTLKYVSHSSREHLRSPGSGSRRSSSRSEAPVHVLHR